MKTVTKLLPGCALALVIAAIAKLLESLEASAGLHLIGASVIALFIGMLVNHFYRPNDATKPGIRFTSKKILKFAIILLGASLNITTVLTVGKFSLTVMLFTLATCFGLGYFIGKALGLNWKTSSLINAGTGICGGSAIAAIAPVIDATDMDVAYGLSATFLFDMVMVVVFPILGRKLGLSDAAFGLWAGTAVNDTSSVVATGYAFSEAAGDFATMVKLTRTLSIIPTVLVFAVISLKLKKKEAAGADASVNVNMKSVFPWFILGFLALSGLTSLGLIPGSVASALKTLSKFLMVAALGAVGLNTDFKARVNRCTLQRRIPSRHRARATLCRAGDACAPLFPRTKVRFRSRMPSKSRATTTTARSSLRVSAHAVQTLSASVCTRRTQTARRQPRPCSSAMMMYLA